MTNIPSSRLPRIVVHANRPMGSCPVFCIRPTLCRVIDNRLPPGWYFAVRSLGDDANIVRDC